MPVYVCMSVCFLFFSWHLRGDLYEITKKKTKKSERRREWSERMCDKECKRVKEIVDLKMRYLNSARLAMSIHNTLTHIFTNCTPYVGNVLWSDVYGMQSENEMYTYT